MSTQARASSSSDLTDLCTPRRRSLSVKWPEPALYLVQPGRTGRREMNMETSGALPVIAGQPESHGSRNCPPRCGSEAHAIRRPFRMILPGGSLLVDLFQELDPILCPVAFIRLRDHQTRGDVKRREQVNWARALQHVLYRAAKADPGRRFHALYDKNRAWGLAVDRAGTVLIGGNCAAPCPGALVSPHAS